MLRPCPRSGPLVDQVVIDSPRRSYLERGFPKPALQENRNDLVSRGVCSLHVRHAHNGPCQSAREALVDRGTTRAGDCRSATAGRPAATADDVLRDERRPGQGRQSRRTRRGGRALPDAGESGWRWRPYMACVSEHPGALARPCPRPHRHRPVAQRTRPGHRARPGAPARRHAGAGAYRQHAHQGDGDLREG